MAYGYAHLIEFGDEVLAEDPVTGERGAHRVSHVWVHDDVMVDFEVDGSVVTTTEDHPFWNVTDGVWEGPQDFDAGDRVLTADGNLLVTGGLVPDTWITGTAFNLTVEDLHTYFVVIADESVLVHNECPWPDGSVVPTDDILDAGSAHLGDGYTEIADGVFQSAHDAAGGFTQFRISPSDLFGPNPPHASFETFVPRPGTVRSTRTENLHVFFSERV
ncbi:polymorphic toxin-type HINT domain-containing protein [Demequina sp.]|uniref:polymorphic toxin-type HINT domain-containing protein n=1 Tax=Demequina sp. TaxID=2050685 RepID=UPI0025C314A9|nr:polymorphic toxin-type HINT domain-containing protein [Demequina sp.]